MTDLTPSPELYLHDQGRQPQRGELLEVAPDLFWLRIVSPLAPMGGVNVWVIRDGDGWAIVDTGFTDADTTEQWDFMIKHALPGGVTKIICTHHHPDHIGQVDMLQNRFDAPLYMSAVEWRQTRNFTGLNAESAAQMAAHLEMLGIDEAGAAQIRALGDARTDPIIIPETFHDLRAGETLRIGDHDWRIATGGGHSPAPALLYNDALQVGIVGDQILTRITPHIGTEQNAPLGDPLGDYFAFLDGMRDTPADMLILPGHGPALRNVGRRVKEIAAHHHDRLDALRIALREGPKRPADVLFVLFGRKLSGFQLMMGLTEAHAHLNHLVTLGEAGRSLIKDQFIYSSNL